GDKGRDHAVAVGHLVFAANEVKPTAQEYSAQAVEAGVDDGQVSRTHDSRSRRRTAARICSLTSAGLIPSPEVSKIPRNWACLSTMTKIVLWMKRSTGDSRSAGCFSMAVSLREPVSKLRSCCFAPVKKS